MGLDKVVHISQVRQSHQLPPDYMVVVTCHDDHRRWKVYGLYMTLGISLCINCIVAAPHATWPRGTFWLVELMLPWVSHWISIFWALVFKILLSSFFPFTSNHCFECFLLRFFSMIPLQPFSAIFLWTSAWQNFLHFSFEVCLSSHFLLLFSFQRRYIYILG